MAPGSVEAETVAVMEEEVTEVGMRAAGQMVVAARVEEERVGASAQWSVRLTARRLVLLMAPELDKRRARLWAQQWVR